MHSLSEVGKNKLGLAYFHTKQNGIRLNDSFLLIYRSNVIIQVFSKYSCDIEKKIKKTFS